jgi:hypothetical protein
MCRNGGAKNCARTRQAAACRRYWMCREAQIVVNPRDSEERASLGGRRPKYDVRAGRYAFVISQERTFGTRWRGRAVRAEALRASRLYPVNYKIVPPGTDNSVAHK